MLDYACISSFDLWDLFASAHWLMGLELKIKLQVFTPEVCLLCCALYRFIDSNICHFKKINCMLRIDVFFIILN